MNATAIILAGGKSSRMGKNKALLPINGKANIERIREQLTPYFSNLLLVTNEFEDYKFLEVTMVKDQYPGKGPLAGIHAGLSYSKTELNFFVACDMPFVSGKLAKYLVEECSAYETVVPIIDDTIHPLFAVYKKSILEKVEQSLQGDRLKIRELLDDLDVHYVKERELEHVICSNIEKIFFNMNNPLDYQKAKNWLKR